MFITITNTKAASADIEATEKFLSDFLPRLKKFPGVLSIYNYIIKERGEGSTIIIWENEDAVKSYWRSELIKEPAAFADMNNVEITREAYPLNIVLKEEENLHYSGR